MLNEKIIRKSENKKRGKFVKIIAGIMIGIVAAGGATWYAIQRLFKNENTPTNSYSISSTDLSDLGKELDSKDGKKAKDRKDKNNGYVESNGKLYVDEESAKNADKVGTSTIDTQGGKLTVDSNGKVKEKETGYEINDEKGNTIASGNENSNGTIDGFEKNEELGGTYEEGEITSDDVKADSNYYDEDGNLIIAKGEFLKKSYLEWAKQNLSTTKPVQKQEETQAPTSAPAPTSSSNAGTYTDSYGNVWNSYQDYLNGINNMDGIYVGANGSLYGTARTNNSTENYQYTK